MRKPPALLLLLLVLLAGACSSPTDSGRKSLLGSWTSYGFAPAEIRMTLTEVARTVNGAGSWVEPTRAAGFSVTGAHAEETISLLLEFKDTADLNFTGEFTDDDTLLGTVTGGPFRGQTLTFLRVKDEE